ncbi:MAG TPA: quinone-dependent dihydroorotate dehydrogenase [Bryobacteraceae bacterium]|nr:quinone-dependent dihydroorotate dehydrogenase [Bryobacteraceae bacterium]
MSLYAHLVRPLLFRTDAERMHDRALLMAEAASASRLLCSTSAAWHVRHDERLATAVAGLGFRHPLGLAAGFDKNGRAVRLWAALGFSHIEIGSVSAEASAGNPKPRLFRLPADRAIVVNYGLPNDGADRIAARLSNVQLGVPLGINIVNTNRGPEAKPESDDAVIDDYVRSIRRLHDRADYLTLNLSCPNTSDGRAFVSDRCRVAALFDAVDNLAPSKPVFLKIAPFADARALEAFLATAERAHFVRGFAVNLPPGKPAGLSVPADRLASMPGAVSGKPCENAVNAAIVELYRRIDRKRWRIIGAGGVFSAEDAYRKIRLGASLVQLLTAFVYEGPGVVRSICAGLGQLLERDGLRQIEDAVGVDVR